MCVVFIDESKYTYIFYVLSLMSCFVTELQTSTNVYNELLL